MSELGEKKFLQNILPSLFVSENFLNGFGHDISILDLGLEKFITFKIDRASKPVTITNNWTSDWSIWGRLGVIANLSDHAAAGSLPKAAMVSIITPRATDVLNIEQIILGCQQACIENGISFVGGDTKEGQNTEVIVSTVGTSNFNSKIQNAHDGDFLLISGLLGGFLAANLIMLNQNCFAKEQIDQAFFLLSNPSVQSKNSQILYDEGVVYSATDLSDGLVDALNSFCTNQIGFNLDIKLIKFHPLAILVHKKLGVQLIDLALSAGDWAIAYVVKKYELDKIPNLDNLYRVGEFNTSGTIKFIEENGFTKNLPSKINEQFINRLEDQKGYLPDHHFKI